jgi:hypothetical protein
LLQQCRPKRLAQAGNFKLLPRQALVTGKPFDLVSDDDLIGTDIVHLRR